MQNCFVLKRTLLSLRYSGLRSDQGTPAPSSPQDDAISAAPGHDESSWDLTALQAFLRCWKVDLILEGTKTVELRRRSPKLSLGDTVFLYVSSPVKALAASFIVGEVSEGDPDTIWNEVEHRAGVEKPEFDTYFSGAATAVAIGVKNPIVLDDPIALDTLRELWEPFTAPQSYRYLNDQMVSALASYRDTDRPATK